MADCARGCGRPAASGKRRPEGRLADFCDACRYLAGRRLRQKGNNDPTDAELVKEIGPGRTWTDGEGWK